MTRSAWRKVVRVVMWTALALFLFIVAFMPWGWTGVITAIALIVTWKYALGGQQSSGRHAAPARPRSLHEFRYRVEQGEQFSTSIGRHAA